MKEKIALSVVFGAGIFAVIMSVIRLRSIYIYTTATDIFQDAIAVSVRFSGYFTSRYLPNFVPEQVNFWSTIEVNVAILCASVPALKPIFTPHHIRELGRKHRYQYHGRDRLSDGSYSYKSRSSRSGSNATGPSDPFELEASSAYERSTTMPSGDNQNYTVGKDDRQDPSLA